MGKNDNLVLTSVKVHPDVFESFKLSSIKNKFLFQKLVNRAMDLYNKSEEFRTQIHNHNNLIMSGSL